MNKLKEQLRFKMLGQLSDEKTNIDINNAYNVAVDFAVLFTSFVGETTLSYKEGVCRETKLEIKKYNNSLAQEKNKLYISRIEIKEK